MLLTYFSSLAASKGRGGGRGEDGREKGKGGGGREGGTEGEENVRY